MSRRCTTALLLALSALPAIAQPKTGKVQPDMLAIGTVYTESIVEASFLVFEAGTDPKIKFDVTPPKFAKVLDKRTYYQQFGPGNDFVCGVVEFAIDTSAAGSHDGEFAVTLGDTKAKLPVTATVKKTKKGYSRVLIAETPFDKHTTSDGKDFEAWTDLVAKSPLDVSYLLVAKDKPVLRDLKLSRYDCIFLASTGLFRLNEADLKRIGEYVEGGGRVVVAADAFFVGTVKQANAVIGTHGLEMQNIENPGAKEVVIDKDAMHASLVRDGISLAQFFRASPVRVIDEKKATVLVGASGVGNPGDGFVAMGSAGKGQVIAIGQSLWWSWISDKRAKGTDNAKLLRWLLVPQGGA